MFIINALKIIFLLGFLVFIHEGGHFLAAKFFGVNVEEFSIGFGPKIFTKKSKETQYCISAIPFGGYVRMTGENERVDIEGAFNKAKLSHRIIIVAAGAIVNIIFAIIIYYILAMCSNQIASTTVKAILPDYAKNISSIEIGDKILEINNKKIRIRNDISDALKDNHGEEIKLLVERNNEKIELKAIPSKYLDTDIYVLGVELEETNNSFGEKIYYSFWETKSFIKSIGESLKLLFTGKVSVNQMTGPIGISDMVAKTNGLYNFVYLLSLISLSLGITNLLPIPALDGGRIVLLIIEGIRGKALKEEIELGIQSAGFIVLILFSFYVSYNDFLRVFMQ